MNEKKIATLWQQLASRFDISEQQLTALKQYAALLQEYNQKFNLTAVEDLEGIITMHFQDSLELTRFVDFNRLHSIADVGTGAGFPGLPLKIMFPHLELLLIEVNHKKISFLATVVEQLDLVGTVITDLDWRTFLRSADRPIDLFLARASLQPEELVRIFKPQSIYCASQLVYFASRHWQPEKEVEGYLVRKEEYEVGGKKRAYIFFAKSNACV